MKYFTETSLIMSRQFDETVQESADEFAETLLETEEEILNALRESLKNQGKSTPSSSLPFTPQHRPPMLILTLFDDNGAEGEQIRIRTPRFVIGRTEGHLQLGLDRQVSSRHVEIAYKDVKNNKGWYLTDLDSRHGLFLRVKKTLLLDRTEILVGSGRYQFLAPVKQACATNQTTNNTYSATAGLPDEEPAHASPQLVEQREREMVTGCCSRIMNTGLARTRVVPSIGPTIVFVMQNTQGYFGMRKGPGTPTITIHETGYGEGCGRFRLNPQFSSGSVSRSAV
ncbi:MAG: FHA domain-containing protein [Planctomycetaceae bacterium]